MQKLKKIPVLFIEDYNSIHSYSLAVDADRKVIMPLLLLSFLVYFC